MKKRFYITTPIYYASGNLHIGHLYTTTLAWTIANYKKLAGYEVLMLTGSDEHGQKIFQKATENGKEPQLFVDELCQKYKQMWVDFGIDYDLYSRTTNLKHKQSIQHIFSQFLDQKYIYKDQYQGLYSVSDEEFLTETQAVHKDGKFYHPTSGHELINVAEESYFFDMKMFSEWLIEYFKTHPNFVLPQKIVNEMMNNFLLKDLDNLSVTRTNVEWGIKTLEDPKHTLYVWLDALCNYITALGYDPQNQKQPELFENFWQDPNTEVVHLLGKEIARFHMIYWPIFLKALNLRLPSTIQAHGWIADAQGRKMSKSLNNIVDPYELLSKYHPEMIKYFLTSQFVLGDDANFDENRFVDVINADLINNFGNLVSRTLKMKSNSFTNPLHYQVSDLEVDKLIESKILESKSEYTKNFDQFKIDKALKVAINLASELNKYIDETKPWTLKDDLSRLEQILVRLLNGIYAVSTYLQVVLPQKIRDVEKALNVNSFSLDFIDNFAKFDNINQADSFMFFERIKK
ncbi:methionine--tRNA ligase [Mycoplasmopsis gallopavonis]|uniref:Methionine--tRNA ligase n=1 Tax=Mycoplasmopsis gallopavonis TaxID=76629 RepID=A0A449B0I5_9BACT|nr:methionine--tRNA ligase [Mycoplasmopsis gallopavonis]RIV17003.1 methionine--tRNA ligase [Mycoplasmopsis gallopavonis]VEU73292.1 Methionine--tRNA ligase [Mycoplasmopsis gallopavonis]